MKKLLCVTLMAGTLFLCSCSADPGTSTEIDATAASVLAQQVVEAKVDEFYDAYAAVSYTHLFLGGNGAIHSSYLLVLQGL